MHAWGRTLARPPFGTKSLQCAQAQFGRIREPIALSLAAALAIVALLGTPRVFGPVLAFAERAPGTPLPGDDEEQLPETDRAPLTAFPGWPVACVAALRLALLLMLHGQGAAGCPRASRASRPCAAR